MHHHRRANFLNNADLDGYGLPPPGADMMMAAGRGAEEAYSKTTGFSSGRSTSDWNNPENTKSPRQRRSRSRRTITCATASSPTACRSPAPNGGLDAQGDEIMERLIYRRVGGRSDRGRALRQYPPEEEVCAGTRSAWTRQPRTHPLPAGHVCARRVVSLDGRALTMDKRRQHRVFRRPVPAVRRRHRGGPVRRIPAGRVADPPPRVEPRQPARF